jgi:anti-sigma regulatory factor (Ser/Thr protein kinase)
MAPYAHRRQVVLFLAAILLPCAALVVLGVRLVIQERELADARLDDERRSVTRQLRSDLASRLERIALHQAGAAAAQPELFLARENDDPSVALVARVSDGRLVFPWEHDEGPAISRTLLVGGAFGGVLSRAQRAEFALEDVSRAAELYRSALSEAEHPAQAAHARLFLARALAKSGRQPEAAAEYSLVATTPTGVMDEHGIPLALYAIDQLLTTGSADTAAVWEGLRNAVYGERWLAPPALYLLRDLLGQLSESPLADPSHPGKDSLSSTVSRDLGRTERALALRGDYAGLGLIPLDADPTYRQSRWVLYGSPPWLVGAAPAADRDQAVVVAVRSGPILAAVGNEVTPSGSLVGEIGLATTAAPEGEFLGPDFPGLFVHFRGSEGIRFSDVGGARWWFYRAGLALVLGVTLFGGYLLWRDVRREVQVAQMRSRFVSAVSHELKTPLTAIRMFAETLQMGRQIDSDTQVEYLDTIVNESERLTRLLNNVLDFSKIERGGKTYRREDHCLAEVVEATARAIRYPLQQQKFNLSVEIEEDLPTARVDRDAIEQAILNLLDNAMKYSGESRDIALRLGSKNGEAVISVSDHGAGVDPTERSRIFEQFYRATSPDGDRVPGTGLGLTLVQHIADAHGGRVTVESAVGEGSTFSLHLPWKEARP